MSGSVSEKGPAGRCVCTERAFDRQAQERRDHIEVVFEKKAGYFRETEDDRVMEKVDTDGNVLGFSIMKVSSLKGKPFEVALA